MGKLIFSSLISLSILSSFVMCIVLFAMPTGGINIWIAISITIVINIVLLFVSPFITDFFNRWFYKTTFLKEEEVKAKFPQVAELISKVCTEKKFRFPKIGIIADKNPTAFSYGSGRYNARIVLTEGIFTFLTTDEVNAVVAHELGHIVNRDFLVMMIATTMIQILYQVYAVLIRIRGKNAGVPKLIAIASYILYWIGTYVLLYLSRTREYMADSFSSRYTKPQDLADALIKIAYGIVTADDSNAAKKLLESTRHLGIIDVKNAKQLGAAAYITHNDPQLLAEVMVFDRVSPWAKVVEFNSTHPLTGKRISRLAQISKSSSMPFAFDVNGAIQRMNIDQTRLYSGFILGIVFYILPVVAFFAFFLFASLFYGVAALCICLILQTFYKFPIGKSSPTTIIDQMRDPYASPLRGKPISLTGQVIGRGIPGYVFSEDMMYQDKSGITYFDYNSIFGFVGDFFFSLKKIKTLFNVPSTADGWFFRGLGSLVSLRSIKTDKETVRSHPVLWSFVIPILIVLVYLYLRSRYGL